MKDEPKIPGDHPTPACEKGMGEIAGAHKERFDAREAKKAGDHAAHLGRIGYGGSKASADPDEA